MIVVAHDSEYAPLSVPVATASGRLSPSALFAFFTGK